jgi:hypothetical protein
MKELEPCAHSKVLLLLSVASLAKSNVRFDIVRNRRTLSKICKAEKREWES